MFSEVKLPEEIEGFLGALAVFFTMVEVGDGNNSLLCFPKFKMLSFTQRNPWK